MRLPGAPSWTVQPSYVVTANAGDLSPSLSNATSFASAEHLRRSIRIMHAVGCSTGTEGEVPPSFSPTTGQEPHLETGRRNRASAIGHRATLLLARACTILCGETASPHLSRRERRDHPGQGSLEHRVERLLETGHGAVESCRLSSPRDQCGSREVRRFVTLPGTPAASAARGGEAAAVCRRSPRCSRRPRWAP